MFSGPSKHCMTKRAASLFWRENILLRNDDRLEMATQSDEAKRLN